MLAGLDTFARRSAYALAWRIRRDQLRVRRLKLLQFGHHSIKFYVGDFRLIEDVIEIFVPADVLAQLFDLFCDVRARYHSASSKRSERSLVYNACPSVGTRLYPERTYGLAGKRKLSVAIRSSRCSINHQSQRGRRTAYAPVG